ncbi:MAG: cadherin-like beta sandwich domain-containing protein [Firmicutes bacterium]|nr:cadherin-like beta sandwich domain-containing protein [Bacillota bacterium]
MTGQRTVLKKLTAALTSLIVVASVCAFAVPAAAQTATAAPAPAALAAPAAATYYVSTAGSDSADGLTEQTAFATLKHAADLAAAGDTILIEPGTYYERVTFGHGGKKNAPITVRAAKYREVIFDGQGNSGSIFSCAGFQDGWFSGPVRYVTVQGIVFQNTPSPSAVVVSGGWTFEDCVFRNQGGLLERGGESTVTRCVMEDTTQQGFSGAFNNIQFKDDIIRRANQSAYSPGGYSGACKVLFTYGLMVDGLTSYDNYGHGWWMDWDNIGYTIKNSTFFGNHAGVATEGGGIVNQPWASGGIFSEGNPGPGLIENNTIYSNDHAAVNLAESGFQAPITIKNNLFAYNGGAVEYRGMTRGDHLMRDTNVYDNLFKQNYKNGSPAWYTVNATGLFESILGALPADNNDIIDHNTYDMDGIPAGTSWAEWRGADTGSNITAKSFAEIQSKLGSEANGQVAPIAFNGANFNVYPLTNINDTYDLSKMHQVPSAEAEANSIDKAIRDAGAGVGDTVTIPVYARKSAVLDAGDGVYVFDVYDLQARHIQVATDTAGKAALEAINPYVTLDAYNLTLTLTRKDADGYVVEGIYGNSGITAVPPEEDNTPAPGTGDGLRAQYFSNRNYSNALATETRSDMETYWANTALTPLPAGVDRNNLTIRYMGQIQPLYSEEYTFYALVGGGVRMWVDDKLVVDYWQQHDLYEANGIPQSQGKITLEAGRKYDIRIDFYPSAGARASSFQWESASQPKETIPGRQLYSTVTAPDPYVPSLSVNLQDYDTVLGPVGTQGVAYTLTGAAETGYNVTVNGTPAAVDENGNFSADLYLKEARNTVAVVASDDAMYNISSKNLTVYAFEPDTMKLNAYQASGGRPDTSTSATNGQYRGMDGSNPSITYSFNAPHTGSYALRISYAVGNDTGAPATVAVTVNGDSKGNVSLKHNGSWDVFQLSPKLISVDLFQGQNTIRLDNSGYNSDYITLTLVQAQPDPSFLMYLDQSSGDVATGPNKDGAAGDFALSGGVSADADVTVTLNGVKSGPLALTPSGSDYLFNTTLDLAYGANTIVVEASNADGFALPRTLNVTRVLKYEAENASGGRLWADSSAANASGGKYIAMDDTTNGVITYTLSNVAVSGIYTLKLYYGNAQYLGQSCTVQLAVNGQRQNDLSLPVNGGWQSWRPSAGVDVMLQAGFDNKLVFTGMGYNVDYITVALKQAVDSSILVLNVDQSDGFIWDATDTQAISGSVNLPAATVTVNGTPSEVGANGAFGASVILGYGVNDIEVKASLLDKTVSKTVAVTKALRYLSKDVPDADRAGCSWNTDQPGSTVTGTYIGVWSPNSITYTVNAPVAGDYALFLRAATASSGGTYEVSVGGKVIGDITVTGTGGWNRYVNFFADSLVPLAKGANRIKLTALSGGANTDYIAIYPNDLYIPSGRLALTVDQSDATVMTDSPYEISGSVNLAGTSVAINGAEVPLNSANGFSVLMNLAPGDNVFVITATREDVVVTQTITITKVLVYLAKDVSASGRVNCSWNTDQPIPKTLSGIYIGVGATSSITFTVNVADAGLYDLRIRYASNNAMSTYNLAVNGADYGTLFLATHGWWDAYTNYLVPGISLNAGQNTIKLSGLTGYVNLDYIFLTFLGAAEITPMELTLDQSGGTVGDALYTVSGSVNIPADISISVNGTVQYTGETDGAFGAQVTLAEGVNTVAVTATDKDNPGNTDSRTITVTKVLIYLAKDVPDAGRVNCSWNTDQPVPTTMSGVYIGVGANSVITFTVNAPVSGKYGLTLRYATNSAPPNTYELAVNGADNGALALDKTAWWNSYVSYGAPGEIALKAGRNTITLTGTAGYVNLDYIALTFLSAAEFMDLTLGQSGGAVSGSALYTVAGSVNIPANVEIAVNGTAQYTGEADGAFSAQVTLAEGVNTVAVTAADKDDPTNADTKTITVTKVLIYLAKDVPDAGRVNCSWNTDQPVPTTMSGIYIGVGANSVITFTVNAPANGNYALTLRYATNNATANTYGLAVIGADNGALTLAKTAWWDSYANYTAPGGIVLRSGQNTIRLSGISGYVNLDYIMLTFLSEYVPSSDATLSALAVGSFELSPAFSPDVTEYALSVPNAVETVTVSAQASSGKAGVSGDLGTIALAVGGNAINVTVTAENGVVNTYTVNVTREQAVLTIAVKSMLAKVAKLQQIPYSYEGAGSVSFASSNPAVCNVTPDGTLVPMKAGIAVITITAPGLPAYVFAVTVTA